MKWRMGLACVLLGVLGIIYRGFAQDRPDKEPRAVIEHKLLYVGGPTVEKEPIRVSVGDMLQFQPFDYPVVPQFLGAKLHVDLEGERVLEVIGEASSSTEKEGRAGQSVFLYVRLPGHTVVHVSLVDSKGDRIERYRTRYEVLAAPAKGRHAKN